MAKFITVSYPSGAQKVLSHRASVTVTIWDDEKEAIAYCQSQAEKSSDMYRFKLTAGTKTARATPPIKEESFPI